MCVLLSGFMGSGTTECQIIYGTDDSYSDLPFMDTGSNTGTIITVPLTATLQPRTTYYYIATATSENVCARQLGSFTTGTLYLHILHEVYEILTVHIGAVVSYYILIGFQAYVHVCACVWGVGKFPLPFPLPIPPSHFSVITFQHKLKDLYNVVVGCPRLQMKDLYIC